MALRDAAVRKGLHVSEYGVLDDATGETHRCATEHEVYALLGLDYIEPELRENRGELEAAAAQHPPEPDHPARPQGRPALPHHRLGRHRLDRGDGGRGQGRRLRVPGDHRPLGRASGSATRSRPTGCASRSPTSEPPTSTASTLLAGSEVNILPDGNARLRRRDPGRARLGDRLGALLVPDDRGPDDRAHDQGHRAPAGRRHRPPVGPQAARNASPTRSTSNE